MTTAERRRRRDTYRFAVAVALNWMLAVLVTGALWAKGGWGEAAQAFMLLGAVAIVSSLGLVVARTQETHSSALVTISYACVVAPFFWVLIVLAVGPG